MNLRHLPWLAAAVTLVVHLLGNAHYGFFRDELYFIICGQHPQFGYVDQPPVVPLLAALSQIFGHSLFLLRLVPALFAAGGAYVTCKLVTEYGGGAFAQVIASLCYLFAGVLLSFGMKVGTDEVGLWTWPLLALLIVRLIKGADPRTWLLVGAVAGLSIESKYSVIFFLVALGIGLLLTPERRVLFDRWFLAGVAVMLAIALPNLLWQQHYGFPMMELLKNGQNGKNVIVGPLLYMVQEILITQMFLAPIWIIGLIWLLRSAPNRVLGYAYIVLIAEMIVFHGKHYYPANVYPILMAAGPVWIAQWTQRAHAVRFAVLAYVLILGPVFVPFSLPILSEDGFLAYQDRVNDMLHIPKSTLATEHGRETAALPGDYADMHGWQELATTVKGVYDSLPPEQRAKAVVVASNYGEAGAINFFTPDVPVISRHNQYWLWGTRGFEGSVIIDVNGDCGKRIHAYRSATLATTFSVPYTIGWETGVPIWVCHGNNVTLQQIWPSIKNYE